MSVAEAEKLAGSNPDYSIKDLYEAILNKDFPSWTMYIQVMSFEDVKFLLILFFKKKHFLNKTK